MTTIPPPERRHGIAELLRLVSAVRRIAHDRTLPPPEALGRSGTCSPTTTPAADLAAPDDGPHLAMGRAVVVLGSAAGSGSGFDGH